MPLHFTEAERQALSKRLLVQPPANQREVDDHLAAQSRLRTIEGLPIDVLETLEAVRLLAEQGNKVAQALYETERIKLGIDRPGGR